MVLVVIYLILFALVDMLKNMPMCLRAVIILSLLNILKISVDATPWELGVSVHKTLACLSGLEESVTAPVGDAVQSVKTSSLLFEIS